MERCAGLARKKGVSFETERFPKALITGDEIYLDRLFANLLENAILYGKKGGHIRIHSQKKNGSIHVDIRDDGIGMSKDDLSRIFERFYRSFEARQKNPDGTGLGLAISKWIAEAHGGTVAVTSAEGTGSTFRVSLPVNGA